MEDQLDLFGGGGAAAPLAAGKPQVRRSDPHTSVLAAQANATKRSLLRWRILWLLAEDMRGAYRGRTVYEMARDLGMLHQRGSVDRRRAELSTRDSGPYLVREMTGPDGFTSITRPTDTGSPAIVWRCTSQGLQVAEMLGPPPEDPAP